MFREEKATELAAYFLSRAGGRPLSRFDLLKLMYAAERFSLRDNLALICGDFFVNMERGPVMSETYNRMKDGGEYWNQYLRAAGWYFRLSRPFQRQFLDEDEIAHARDAWEKYHDVILRENIEVKTEFFHKEFPEWNDPKPFKRTALELKSIFRSGLREPASVAEEKQELIRNVSSILKASAEYAPPR